MADKSLPALLGVFFIGAAIYMCAYVVPEGHQAILLEFGKPIGASKTEAGLYWKLPYRSIELFEKLLSRVI